MKNLIGYIHETRELTDKQIEKATKNIKKMLCATTIEIKRPEHNSGFYSVTTDDETSVDFKLDSYKDDKVSLVKYNTLDEDGNRDPYGAILTACPITC